MSLVDKEKSQACGLMCFDFFPALLVLAGCQAISPPVKMPLIPGDFLPEQVKQEYQVGGTD